MDMKQILIRALILALVPVCITHRCYDDEHELSEAAERKLRNHYPQSPEPKPTAALGSPATCPVELYQQEMAHQLSDRSLSPWRYVLKKMDGYFPSSYVQAECLCLGCILIQDRITSLKESHDYNSVPITQKRVFLKRELCDDGQKYYLRPESVEVAVGCTCARSKS